MLKCVQNFVKVSRRMFWRVFFKLVMWTVTFRTVASEGTCDKTLLRVVPNIRCKNWVSAADYTIAACDFDAIDASALQW